jgi:hypothetical protein
MTEQRKFPEHHDVTPLVEQYLGLESMEVTENLLDLCGAGIDTRALLLLKQRLHEEEEQIPQLEARGYVRMCEKCDQLVASLRPLIAALEQEEYS